MGIRWVVSSECRWQPSIRGGAAVSSSSTLSASLELVKEGDLEARQMEAFADIYLRARKGDAVASVINKSFDLNGGIDNTTGTVAPDVERVIKGAQ